MLSRFNTHSHINTNSPSLSLSLSVHHAFVLSQHQTSLKRLAGPMCKGKDKVSSQQPITHTQTNKHTHTHTHTHTNTQGVKKHKHAIKAHTRADTHIQIEN